MGILDIIVIIMTISFPEISAEQACS